MGNLCKRVTALVLAFAIVLGGTLAGTRATASERAGGGDGLELRRGLLTSPAILRAAVLRPELLAIDLTLGFYSFWVRYFTIRTLLIATYAQVQALAALGYPVWLGLPPGLPIYARRGHPALDELPSDPKARRAMQQARYGGSAQQAILAWRAAEETEDAADGSARGAAIAKALGLDEDDESQALPDIPDLPELEADKNEKAARNFVPKVL